MATKKKVETKERATPKAAPARVRPSRAKATASVALEHKQAMRDTGSVVKPLKPARVTADVRTKSTDPLLRLDPDLIDTEVHTPANSPIRAEIAERLAVYQLELEYKHYEDDSNPVASLIKRNAQEASTHSATLSLVIDDYTKYVNDGGSASGSGIIELAEGGQLTEELKYYVYKAIDKFTTAVDSRITVTRVIVQRFTLPGIVFII